MTTRIHGGSSSPQPIARAWYQQAPQFQYYGGDMFSFSPSPSSYGSTSRGTQTEALRPYVSTADKGTQTEPQPQGFWAWLKSFT